MYLGKFVHTETGKVIMSILLGFGLASLFRTVCKDKDCLLFYAPPLEKIKDKMYRKMKVELLRSREPLSSTFVKELS